MGTDCGLLIKVKGEKKYYKAVFDRAYCFEHISIGPDFEIKHDGLRDNNGMVEGSRRWQGKPVFITTEEIKLEHAKQWATERIAFLTQHREALEKDDTRVSYHLRWVDDFLRALEIVETWDNVETLWLANDNGETYDDIVFEDGNEIIDLSNERPPFPVSYK